MVVVVVGKRFFGVGVGRICGQIATVGVWEKDKGIPTVTVVHLCNTQLYCWKDAAVFIIFKWISHLYFFFLKKKL